MGFYAQKIAKNSKTKTPLGPTEAKAFLPPPFRQSDTPEGVAFLRC
jgi:hypothetical protein